MVFYGHIKNTPAGTVEHQFLRDHLRNTAETAKKYCSGCALGNAAYLAGLLHDLGKYTGEFQAYLEQADGKRGSVIHTFQGCRFLMERFHEKDPEAAELLAYAIGAHHGLFDCVDETGKIGLKYRAEKAGTHFKEAQAAFLSDCADETEIDALFSKAAEEIAHFLEQIDPAYPDDSEYCFTIGLAERMLASAVMEGDRQDTAAFMNGAHFPVWPEEMRPIWRERLDFLEEKLGKFSRESHVDKARHAISEQCRRFAEQPGGIYRLNVPTGGGKTLSALRYALAHAAKFNQKHLIFTSPLLSILEQNAAQIRKYLGDDSLILEHHSNVVQVDTNPEELDKRELLVQSWDAPVIITTLVQLLNTMFDGKTTSVRRFHALCDSVIVIDEVQTVPGKLLTQFNLAIRFLSGFCGATVVLCSATQPCLEQAAHPLPETPRDIVPWDPALWAAFARTEILPLAPVRLEQLPELVREKMDQTDSLLVVCNMKKEAATLLNATRDSNWRSFHLSADMCTQHRRETLRELFTALERNEKVLCISTQVIEAGVNISFGSVIRLAAGMDSVVQSAGRCNRHGESPEKCPVYVVECSDENLGNLPEIQRGKRASLDLIHAWREDPDSFGDGLSSDASIAFYYRTLYRSMNGNAQDYPLGQLDTTLFDLLSVNEKYANDEKSEDYCLRQAFAKAGKAFTVFDEDTTDVIVPYSGGKQIIEQLGSQKAMRDPAYQRNLLKQAGNFSVSLYSGQKKRLEAKDALFPLCGGCALALREEFYDPVTGLNPEGNFQTYQEV